MGISEIRRTCEQMRSHARRLNPLPRAVLVRPDANFLLRQGCAPTRSGRSGRVPWPLTATVARSKVHRVCTSKTKSPARKPTITRFRNLQRNSLPTRKQFLLHSTTRQDGQTMTPNAQHIYREHMREIRYRNLYIEAVGNNPHLGVYRQTRIESICLQIRLILENIALACLVANGDRLDKLPKKIEREYHAETILRRLDRINPDCFPQPLVLIPASRNMKTFQSGNSVAQTLTGKYRGELVDRPDTDWMTRKEFREVYGRLGGILHAANPLGNKTDYDYFENIAPKWQDKYMNLLGHHKISVIEDDMMYIVQMNAVPSDKTGSTDGDVQVSTISKARGHGLTVWR